MQRRGRNENGTKLLLSRCFEAIFLAAVTPFLLSIIAINEGTQTFKGRKRAHKTGDDEDAQECPPPPPKKDSWLMVSRKKREILPQTAIAAFLPEDILIEIFKHLGPVLVDKWHFKNSWGKPRVDNDRHSLSPAELHRQYELRHLVHVCKRWYAVANSMLYQHVDIYDFADLRLFVRTLECAPQLARLVRSFTHFSSRYSPENHNTEELYGLYIRNLCRILIPRGAELYLGTEKSAETKEILPYLGESQIMSMELEVDDPTLKRCIDLGVSFASLQSLTLQPGVWQDLRPPFASMFPQLRTLRFFHGYFAVTGDGNPHIEYFRLPKLQRLEFHQVRDRSRTCRVIQAMLELYVETLQHIVMMDVDAKASLVETTIYEHVDGPPINLSMCTSLKSASFGYFFAQNLVECGMSKFKFPPSLEELEYRMEFSRFRYPVRFVRMKGSNKRDGNSRDPAYRNLKQLPNLKTYRIIGMPIYFVNGSGGWNPEFSKRFAADDIELELLGVVRHNK